MILFKQNEKKAWGNLEYIGNYFLFSYNLIYSQLNLYLTSFPVLC